MHLLVAQSGAVDDGAEPRDLSQSPGDVVILSAADTELALIAEAHRQRAGEGGRLDVRLANFLHLKHNYSVDLHIEKTLSRARLVVVRLLGGRGYWTYGLERLEALAAQGVFELVVLPGDDKPDASLADSSSVDPEVAVQLWQYLCEGGLDNAKGFLAAVEAHLGGVELPLPARPLLKAGIYGAKPRGERPIAAIVFYRALYQSGDLAAIDALISELRQAGLDPLPVFVSSLRDGACVEIIEALFRDARPRIILNTTSFATSKPGDSAQGGVLGVFGVPVLQVVLASETAAAWREGLRGLSARDIAMHVALPEVDGRVLTRAVSFKADARFDTATQYYVVRAEPDPGRVRFVAGQAQAWVRLGKLPAAGRRVALVLANYPNRDGRIANGVGLDTPQSTIKVLNALQGAGYGVEKVPVNGNALVELLQAGVTNAGIAGREVRYKLSGEAYGEAYARLPPGVREAVEERWGQAEDDPFWCGDGFTISVCRFGNVAVGIQPARGYNVDPKATYHDPALIPPHNYLAFYVWLRSEFGAHAVV
ncbi:MAG TPA: cobaltochelatase subunit CobN, partial [Hyphomicrobiaceae bacterium]|nr:cobaltochelatase subunit CobN [Hyphomicrobiaceae bacterium]